MKKITALAGIALASSTTALAADCGSIFQAANAWIASDSHLVRVVTTLNGPNNKVEYTRGYLNPDDVVPGALSARSLRYTNAVAAADGSPFSAANADKMKLTLLPTGGDGAQLNYEAEARGGTSIGYSMTCIDNNMMYMFTSDGMILTLSLRFDSTQ